MKKMLELPDAPSNVNGWSNGSISMFAITTVMANIEMMVIVSDSYGNHLQLRGSYWEVSFEENGLLTLSGWPTNMKITSNPDGLKVVFFEE